MLVCSKAARASATVTSAGRVFGRRSITSETVTSEFALNTKPILVASRAPRTRPQPRRLPITRARRIRTVGRMGAGGSGGAALVTLTARPSPEHWAVVRGQERGSGVDRSERCRSTNARPRSAADACRPDQQIEDPHLGEVVAPSYELPPGRAQRPAIEVEVAFVAADERKRAFSELSAYSEVVVGQVRLDDAVDMNTSDSPGNRTDFTAFLCRTPALHARPFRR